MSEINVVIFGIYFDYMGGERCNYWVIDSGSDVFWYLYDGRFENWCLEIIGFYLIIKGRKLFYVVIYI